MARPEEPTLTGPDLLRPAAFPSTVLAGFSTRIGGVSGASLGMNLSFRVGDTEQNVRTNRGRFFGAFGIRPEELAIPGQVHSARVQRIDHPGTYPDCDGLVTLASRVFVCVSFADCVPMLLVDPVAHVVASVHGGWRGTAAGIAGRAVQVMTAECGAQASRIRACIGPAAGSCCYEVGEDVAAAFPVRFRRESEGRIHVDLKAVNARQLFDAGILPENVEVMPQCTIGQPARFHSYRRDRQMSGRMMGFAGYRGGD